MPWTKVCIDKNEFDNILGQKGLRGLNYQEALKEAQTQLLKKDDTVFLLGEGIDDPGGVFGSTLDLCKEFGPERVMDIPLAENGLTGVAIGAAMAGMKPIFIHMRMDFLPLCMDQIINHAAKWCYMTGGKVHVPLVIRCIIGRGWGSAAQHSQALHSLFIHVPGLKVVIPSTPYDAKGLLISAVSDGNPVLFVEHRWLYNYKGYVPEEMYKIPFGKGVIRRKGKDVTIIALSLMVYEAIKSSNILEKEGIDCEIVDPRTIVPLDEDIIFESVKKTGRVIIADVAHKTGGCGAEIAAIIVEKMFNYLKTPIKRVNFPDVPIPCSPVLEDEFYPDANDIVDAVKELMSLGSSHK